MLVLLPFVVSSVLCLLETQTGEYEADLNLYYTWVNIISGNSQTTKSAGEVTIMSDSLNTCCQNVITSMP